MNNKHNFITLRIAINVKQILNDKKGCKVRDHNHLTSEYRGCAHNVCNINYNYKNF